MRQNRNLLDLHEDEPNRDLARKFYLEAWADSHRLVADGFAGKISFPDFIDGCVKTFAQVAAVHVDFIDDSPIEVKSEELDRLTKLSIRQLRRKFAAAPKRLRKPLDDALEDYSRRVKEIAARSKEQIFRQELDNKLVSNDSGQSMSPEQAERSRIRKAVVMPILAKQRWTRGKWATQAGVGKNSVYEYLDGKRNLTPENRRAMAEVIDLKPEDLPE